MDVSIRLPPLESLRVLEACVRHSNFTRAAAELGVTPTAVSQRIRDLEGEMRTPLFRRHGPKVAPTEAGLALAAAVAHALKGLDDAVRAQRGAALPLRVSVSPTFASRWLGPRLGRYHARNGAVPIQLDVSMELRSADMFDVAIRTGEGPWPGLDAVPLMPVEVTPMLDPTSAASVRTPSDLARGPLLPHPDWLRWFAQAGAEVRDPDIYSNDYPTHDLDAIAAMDGAGSALLPPRFFGQLLREGRLVQPFDTVLSGPAWHHALYRSDRRSEEVRDFIDWLKDEIEAGDDGSTVELRNMVEQ